ncbi:hypothetical protein Undi14_04690 [Undibacterium sp. 14-3-2]|uniref:GapS4b family protein n=1 Tax=Undibacterium sp. 14-3-2 TaxID=2800129 RepID=UPI001902CBBA|nr:hypothetical protein [Undibacterium sp. 14-3-2]MBK1889320.1 hypothetical protein [Undibacterium sp. 14-3-2]
MSETIKEKVDADNWLPYGEQLRILLGSDHISYGEVATVLRGKGVFCSNTEKSNTIPILSTSILRPFEFVSLLEASISRETRPKEQPQDIKLASDSANWQNSVKALAGELVGLVHLDGIPGVTFASNPSVSFSGPNSAAIEYAINRTDYSQDLLGRDLNFFAKILIEQKAGSLTLKILSQHSSKETGKINDQLVRSLTQKFKIDGVSDNSEPRKILFKSFDNKNRILFLLKLAAEFGVNKGLGIIVDVNIRRNEFKEALPDDPGIKWMEGTMRNLKIDGDKLNDISIFSSEDYFEYFFITKLVVEYEFEIAQNSGTCTLIYSFDKTRNFARIMSAPFTYSIDKFTIKGNTSSKVSNSVKNELAAKIRSKIDDLFAELMIKD